MRKIPEGERERRNGRERNGKWKRAALEKSQNWGRQKNADLNLTHAGRHLSGSNGNCDELRMRLSKFVCVNMPGFLATFRSQNLL